MSARSSSEEETPLLFSERPEWSDITPIPQYETNSPIAQILYSPECSFMTSHDIL